MGLKSAYQLKRAGIKKINEDFLSFQAFENIAPGEIVDLLKDNKVPKKSRYTVQVNVDLHYDVEAPTKYTNHSCEPNCKMDVQTGQLVAIKEIKSGQEITFDYCTTEYEMAEQFKCNCKSKMCRGFIQGFKYLNTEEKKDILPRTSEWIKQYYKENLDMTQKKKNND